MEIIDHFGQNMGNIGIYILHRYSFEFLNIYIKSDNHHNNFRFVPRERWLHNIEHGAVVMLYDPCVLDSEVNKLRKIVRSCIKKHVITPTTFLTRERVSI